MKIIRSSKCILKYTTHAKSKQLKVVLKEYGKVVNFFIKYFWKNGIVPKKDLLKPIVDLSETWLSARLRKVAAREALDMIKACQEVLESNKEMLQLSIDALENKIKEIKTRSNTKQNRRKINNLHCKLKKKQHKVSMMQPQRPKHKGKSMNVSSTIAELQESRNPEFDAWLHLTSIGNKIILDLPIRFHDRFHELGKFGKRLNSYVIHEDYVQFAFEIDTGPKKEVEELVGIDTGINALASLSNGDRCGLDIKECIERVKRCQYGSKGRQRAINALKQRISEVAKEVVSQFDLIVVENLKNMNNNSKLKGRLSRNMRSSIGIWNYRYWLSRLEQQCELNRVSFRTVSPYYTSQRCFQCGHISRGNRDNELFQCQKCGHAGNADINAACNILNRFLTGMYGSCYKPLAEFCYEPVMV